MSYSSNKCQKLHLFYLQIHDQPFLPHKAKVPNPFCASKIICQTRALWRWYSSKANHICTSNSQDDKRWKKEKTHSVVQVNTPLNKSSSHSPGHLKQYELHLLWISSNPSSQVQTDNIRKKKKVQTDKQQDNLFFSPSRQAQTDKQHVKLTSSLSNRWN